MRKKQVEQAMTGIKTGSKLKIILKSGYVINIPFFGLYSQRVWQGNKNTDNDLMIGYTDTEDGRDKSIYLNADEIVAIDRNY